jgi:dCMP deaminase
MAMKKIDHAHMKAAEAYAELSYAIRLKVGAIITKDNRVISIGYNGTPAGWDNNCELEVRNEFEYYIDHGGEKYNGATIDLLTKDEVIHAEANAILYAAKNKTDLEGSTLYVTLSPCLSCARIILSVGIKKVLFLNSYAEYKGIDVDEGVEFLRKFGVEVESYKN